MSAHETTVKRQQERARKSGSRARAVEKDKFVFSPHIRRFTSETSQQLGSC